MTIWSVLFPLLSTLVVLVGFVAFLAALVWRQRVATFLGRAGAGVAGGGSALRNGGIIFAVAALLLGVIWWNWGLLSSLPNDPSITQLQAWTVVKWDIEKIALLIIAGCVIWYFAPAFKSWKENIRRGVVLFWLIMPGLLVLGSGLQYMTQPSNNEQASMTTSIRSVACTTYTKEMQLCPYGDGGLAISTSRRNDAMPVPCFDKAPRYYIDSNGRQQPWNPGMGGYANGYVFYAATGERDAVNIWLSASASCPK
ncbi:MAG: hypothetical protein Q7R54_00760 [bacterium]|nr:hypothetical protein [bacterium]